MPHPPPCVGGATHPSPSCPRGGGPCSWGLQERKEREEQRKQQRKQDTHRIVVEVVPGTPAAKSEGMGGGRRGRPRVARGW